MFTIRMTAEDRQIFLSNLYIRNYMFDAFNIIVDEKAPKGFAKHLLEMLEL